MNNEHGQHNSIAVNQLGYRSQDAKVAVIAGQGGRFHIVHALNGEVVWQGHTSPAIEDVASGQTVSRGISPHGQCPARIGSRRSMGKRRCLSL